MKEINEAERSQLESRISDVIGGESIAVPFALSFYPDIAENFIAEQEKAAKAHGSKAFWFKSAPEPYGIDITNLFPEALNIVQIEIEIARIRGETTEKEYLPDIKVLQNLVTTFENGHSKNPYKNNESSRKIRLDMRRKALQKLAVIDEEILTIKEYLNSDYLAMRYEQSAKDLENQAVQLVVDAKSKRQAASDQMLKARNKITSRWPKRK